MTEVSAGTLTDFLLARIAEDEAAVQVAANHPGAAEIIARLPNELFVHVARQGGSPRRASDECAAKRRIVADHGADGDFPFIGNGQGRCTRCDVQHPCPTLAALASVYADHEHFRPEWRI